MFEWAAFKIPTEGISIWPPLAYAAELERDASPDIGIIFINDLYDKCISCFESTIFKASSCGKADGARDFYFADKLGALRSLREKIIQPLEKGNEISTE